VFPRSPETRRHPPSTELITGWQRWRSIYPDPYEITQYDCDVGVSNTIFLFYEGAEVSTGQCRSVPKKCPKD